MKRPGKIFAIILTALFLCWISLVILNEPLQFYKEARISKSENRTLARKPLFNPGLLDPYPKAYETYFNDHFLFRPQLLRFNTLTNYFLYDKSPAPEDVTIGKRGWLYLAQKEKQVYTGKYMLNNRQIRDIVGELNRRAAVLKQMGTKFYVVFAPMKQVIYPEFLPPDLVHNPSGTVTEKIVEEIRKSGGINYIDLVQPLMEAKKYGRLYNKTDNHWNMLGAYYAYREIAEQIRKDFPAVKLVENSDFSFHDTIVPSGNLAIMTDLSDYMKENDIIPRFKRQRVKAGQKAGYKPPNNELGDQFELVRVVKDTTLPTALVIRDSFTNALIPFLDETFRKTVYIFDGWHYSENKAIVDGEKPDIVLLIIFEPHISHLTNIP